MEMSFDIDVATEYGVNEAILIKNIQFWILKNKANSRHFYDGHYWTYNSLKAFGELFKFWSQEQTKRLITKLLDKGVLIKGNYNKSSYDRTLWYAFADEDKWIGDNSQIHLAKSTNGMVEITKPIPDINTYINTDKEINNNKLLFTKKEGKFTLKDIKYYWMPIAKRWGLPTVEAWTDKRNAELATRLKELNLTLEEFFDKLGDLIAVSPFLRGKRWITEPNGEARLENADWKGSIDFFIAPGGCAKTFEGKYSERAFLNKDGTVPHFNYERKEIC